MPSDLTVTVAGTAVPVYLGENTALAQQRADAAAASATDAALSAATAESVSGPTYASTVAGLAATANGQAFAVDNGDGTVTVYLNSSGAAVAQRTLATTDALASLEGAGLVGWIAAGVSAVARTVLAKLREQKVSIDDYGAVGDGTTDDTNALLLATTALSSTGGCVLFSRGKHYVIGDHTMVRGVTYAGESRSFIDLFMAAPVAKITCKAGATGIFRNAATQLDSLAFRNLFLYSPSGRGHIFDWSLGGIVAKVDMKGITAIQEDSGKRIIHGDYASAGGGIFSIWISDFDFQYQAPATVSPVYIRAETVNSITFRQGWITLIGGNTTASTTKQIHIESTNPDGPAFNINIQDIEFEIPRGGCVGLYSVSNCKISNSMAYDLTVPPSAPMFEVRRGTAHTGNPGVPSTNVTFENVRSTVGTVAQPDVVLDCSIPGQGAFRIDSSTLAVLDGVSPNGGAQTVIHGSSIVTKQNISWLQIGGGPNADIVFGSSAWGDWAIAQGFAGSNPGMLKFLFDGVYYGGFSAAALFQWGGTESNPNFYIVPGTGEFRSKQPLYPPDGAGGLQSHTAFIGGNGAPINAVGADGQFFFRGDGTTGARIYHKVAGAWVAVV